MVLSVRLRLWPRFVSTNLFSEVAEYSVFNEDVPPGFRVIKPEHGLHYITYLGALGVPGQTAYYGWKEYAHAKAVSVMIVAKSMY